MHIIFEAFRRRPLESRGFSSFRALSAIIFGALFIVYCIYLIIQVVNDVPLLLLSRKELDRYRLPQIEMCSQNSTMTVVRCDLMYMNWTASTIPNCYDYITTGSKFDNQIRCYLFDSGSTFKYGIEKNQTSSTGGVRRIDIYWKIDSIVNITLASVAIPSISVELRDPNFSRWYPPEYIPESLKNDMEVSGSQLSSTQNQSTAIKFSPNLYRAIRPGDFLSLLGFAPVYIDLPRVEATQLDWPLQESENITRGDYQGLFNVEMVKHNLDIQSERRQYTILSAVALAGGAYGALSTLYVLLFGMLRLSPFGVFHQIPIKTLRGIEAIRKMRRKSTQTDDADFSNNNKSDQLLLDDAPQPSKLDTLYTSVSKNGTADSSTIQQQPTSIGNAENEYSTEPSLNRDCCREGGSSSKNNNAEQSSQIPNHNEYPAIVKRVHQLELQLYELQQVLREYYIDMDYLDSHRIMRRRGQKRKIYCSRQCAKNMKGGWIFDNDDDEDDNDDNPSRMKHC